MGPRGNNLNYVLKGDSFLKLFLKIHLGTETLTSDHSVVPLACSHVDMQSFVIRTFPSSPFRSEVCDPLGGGDAVGAGLHWPHARSDTSQHEAAAEGILHVPEPGRGLWGHQSAG